MTLDISWAEAADLSQLPSPALLFGRDAIEHNLQKMLQIAGSPHRLCPHVKTHKSRWLIERQLALGISRFKCATIAEAEICALAGARHVLMAIQPVGPNPDRLLSLRRAFPGTTFGAVIDNEEPLRVLAAHLSASESPLEIFLDLDVGQHRTGVSPGPEALALYGKIVSTPNMVAAGLHAYDGQISQADPAERAAACAEAFKPVLALRDQLLAKNWPVPRLIAGGSPTFALHAADGRRECGPGTTVLWDASYGTKLRDLPFRPAAALLTRVISKPSPNRLCVDLGHKAVASEMPHPRVIFPRLPDAQFVTHSEEHLLLETVCAAQWPIGSALLGVPWHVCPTVALHAEAVMVEHGKISGACRIDARVRRISI